MPIAATVPTDAAEDPFDLSRPSPLPAVASGAPLVEDEALRAEQRVTHADRGGDPEEKVRARLALADAWLARYAVGPALDALRAAEKIVPGHAETLERLARTLPRASLLREAAVARKGLARLRPSPATLHAAACAWMRADDHAEASEALDELVRLAPDDPRAAALLFTYARLRAGAVDAPQLVTILLDSATQARRRDDRERWREYSLNAWIESKGAEGGELLSEALASTGRPRAAVYVAADAAARARFGETADLATASRLLMRCARLAESAGLPGEAVSAWIVHALLPGGFARDARESLRDVLAEQSRGVDLAARLRADARRAAPSSRSAAWKGVAAIEISSQPGLAAQALVEALRHQPEDPEAFELLSSLAQDPAVNPAVRDALWSLARGPTAERGAHALLLVWLAELEERAGDPASAQACLAAIVDPAPEVYEAIARLHQPADALASRADVALRTLEDLPPAQQDAAFEGMLADFASSPGAFRDPRRAVRVLGPRALRDERAMTLQVRVVRRSDDPAQTVAALHRISTRGEAPELRARAALECAELLDQDGRPAEAAEVLVLLLDEQPGDVAAAATLAALAEHAGDASLSLDALRAVARAATDPWERDFLLRFTGRCEGIFGVFASSLSDPSPTQQRCDDLARLHDLVGDSAALLALRARALMAQSGSVPQALEVARRFAAFAPLSPEATIAWFGAANVSNDAEQIADAAMAVSRSLASVRDVSAVTRTALARLESLDAAPRARAVAVEAASAVGLSDRALRTAVLEMLRRVKDTPEALPLVEHLAACAGALDEHVPALRTLAEGYKRKSMPALELAALWRLRPHDREHTTARLLELVPRTGDRARYAKLLAEQLDAARDPSTRRAGLLAIAAEYAAADPPRMEDAIECVDRVAQEGSGGEVQGIVVRALIALGHPEAALGRLMRWSAECNSDQDASARMLCATRIARDVMRSPARALTTLRAFLRRMPSDAAALEMAEEISVESASFDTMFAIYNDLTALAAGEHARHAIAYRRACLHERAGRLGDALDEQFALFMKYPSLGASFSAVARLAERSGRFDILVRALGLLATDASTPEVRAKYYLQAAEVARSLSHDARLALLLELLGFQSSRDPTAETQLRRRIADLRASAPEVSRVATEQLIDDSLYAATQTWDDNARRTHSLHALELCLGDANDPARAGEAAFLFLKQHDDPPAAERTVLDLIECYSPSEAVRKALMSVPAMRGEPMPEDSQAIASPEAKPALAAVMDFDTAFSPESFAEPEAPPPPPPPPPQVLPPAPPARSSEGPTERPSPQSARPSERPSPQSVRPSERPSQLRPRTPRPSARPSKQPFNPRAAKEAGFPVRTATPLYTASGSSAPPRRSYRPSATPSQSPRVELPTNVRESVRPQALRGASQYPPPEVTIEPAAPSMLPSAAPPPDAQPRVRVTVSALREAAAAGDDTAASLLARHLAQSEDTRDEALMLQRRRFEEDPSRPDALESLVEMYASLRMRNEASALASELSVLSGRPITVWPSPPALAELAEPLEGVARVLFPQQLGPFPELGALAWEAFMGRRDSNRERLGAAHAHERSFVAPANEFGRMYSAAVRLLQLPKNTPVAVRTDLPDGCEIASNTTPPTVLVAASNAHDTARSRYFLGVALESTRAGHLPITANDTEEGERMVMALHAAFGRSTPGRLDPSVGRIASRLYEGTPPRMLRRTQDLVEQLGPKLTYENWRGAVALSQMHAAMLVCGDFRAATEALLRAAPADVSRDAPQALKVWEPLRALARFAASEEYLLLRWQRVRPDRW